MCLNSRDMIAKSMKYSTFMEPGQPCLLIDQPKVKS
jgi:hypothetical protein